MGVKLQKIIKHKQYFKVECPRRNDVHVGVAADVVVMKTINLRLAAALIVSVKYEKFICICLPRLLHCILYLYFITYCILKFALLHFNSACTYDIR